MNHQFAEDIRKSFSSNPKYIPSKYLYNERGDELFRKIMHLEEYYPSTCEHEIIQTHKEEIFQFISKHNTNFNLIELGAGDGHKTIDLLHHFFRKNSHFSYIPVDISGNVLQILENKIREKIPEIAIESIEKEYFEALRYIRKHNDKTNIVLVLGGNLGNFTIEGAHHFLTNLHKSLKNGDFVLIGFDLKKDPMTILQAYNDSLGVTRDFNLNLLQRINQELQANFRPDLFYYYPTYNPLDGEVKSFLVSTTHQTVDIPESDISVTFQKGETIFTEISKKYELQEINELAANNYFTPVHNFFDENHYFVNTLWRVHQ